MVVVVVGADYVCVEGCPGDVFEMLGGEDAETHWCELMMGLQFFFGLSRLDERFGGKYRR